MNKRNSAAYQGPEMLLAELLGLHPSRSCPRWAVLGPRYSGKTHFLLQFVDECRKDGSARAPLPIYLDLKKLPIAAEEEMYRSIFRELDLACRHLPFEVSGDGPPDRTGRFDHFVKDLLVKANSRVALVVDHLDSVPQFFGRSLVRRFRLMVDQEELHPEFKNLCVLLGGCTSLFDLRRTGDSAFIASNLTFPRFSNSAWLRHLGSNGTVDVPVEDKLIEETGGEAVFLDLLFDKLDSVNLLTTKKIDAAVERLLSAPQRHDVLHQIALEIASNLDLRNLVQDLLASRGGSIIRRDASPDVDHFCLSGVVVLHKEQSFASYRFRNRIIERFCKRCLNDPETNLTYFAKLGVIREVRTEFNQSRDIHTAMKKLLGAWPDCVFGVQAPVSVFLHISYFDVEVENWLDVGRRRERGSSDKEEVPASAKRAVVLSNELSPRQATFGFDERTVSFSIPFARPEASFDLVLSFQGDLVSGLNENSLSHWLRLLDDCWPNLAASALADMSYYLAKRLVDSRVCAETLVDERDTRIHWMGADGIILDAPGQCLFYSIGRSAKQVETTIDDMNQRCLRMMEQGRSAAEFGAELRGVADQLQGFFDYCPNFASHLQTAGSNFVFISDESGLKLPIELLPVYSSYVGLESRMVRRLRNVTPRVNHMPFAACIRDLIERGEPLKVLLAGADPRNSLEKLEEELRLLREKIESWCAAIGLKSRISVLEPINGTQNALGRCLKDKDLGPFHIFHFCGHGQRGRNGDESSLILRGSRGEDDPVSCEKLRLLLQDHVLWMAYLSCCYGAAARGSAGIEQQYVGTIQAVLSAGIATVIGFRWAVTDVGAYALASTFYEHLFSAEKSFSPSKALWHARRSVAEDDDKRDAWASSLLVSQFG